MMGYISDHTRSRWGRRRPYIFVGAILAGTRVRSDVAAARGSPPSFYFWFFLVASVIYFLTYTVYATPFVAFGYEMTPTITSVLDCTPSPIRPASWRGSESPGSTRSWPASCLRTPPRRSRVGTLGRRSDRAHGNRARDLLSRKNGQLETSRVIARNSRFREKHRRFLQGNRA